MFENRLLRRMFGVKGEEVMGSWRKLLDEVFLCVLFTKYF
jgi:hypothetical protein